MNIQYVDSASGMSGGLITSVTLVVTSTSWSSTSTIVSTTKIATTTKKASTAKIRQSSHNQFGNNNFGGQTGGKPHQQGWKNTWTLVIF
jgi:hypothetical protein